MLMAESPMASQRLVQARRFRLKTKTASPSASSVLSSGIRNAMTEKSVISSKAYEGTKVREYDLTPGEVRGMYVIGHLG